MATIVGIKRPISPTPSEQVPPTKRPRVDILSEDVEAVKACYRTDFVLKGKSEPGREFPVNSMLLVNYSEIMRACIESGMKESIEGKIKLNYDDETVGIIVRHLYAGIRYRERLPIPLNLCWDVMEFAHMHEDKVLFKDALEVLFKTGEISLSIIERLLGWDVSPAKLVEYYLRPATQCLPFSSVSSGVFLGQLMMVKSRECSCETYYHKIFRVTSHLEFPCEIYLNSTWSVDDIEKTLLSLILLVEKRQTPTVTNFERVMRNLYFAHILASILARQLRSSH